MDDMMNDERFAHLARDPKFRRIPKAERKVKIDKRFQSMFKDKKFAVKYTVDKRGRPTNQTSTENLKKYYDISSSDDESSERTLKQKDKQLKKNKKITKVSDNISEPITTRESEKNVESNDEISESDTEVPSSNGSLLRVEPLTEDSVVCEDSVSANEGTEETNSNILKADLIENEKQLHLKSENEKKKLSEQVKKRLKDLSINYARGEGVLLTDSSSDEESSEYSDEADDIEHDWGELDKEADTTEEITYRLAVCNMDWDRIRAVDLMVLFNSFLPGGGLIRSVMIYPSEFGIQRMKEEEIKGPIELVEAKEKNGDLNLSNDENEEGSAYHMEKLRQYQLNRLKYYYAVVVCDSAETANKIYTECDNVEYESTSTKLDLRFIPDDMTFDQEPKEVCNELPDISKYQPRQFTTTALQQVKVELTWDENNLERKEITEKLRSGKINEVNESDIQAYLASGTSDDEENEDKIAKVLKENEETKDLDSKSNEDGIAKYKLLLKSIEEQEEVKKNQEIELEFTWGLGNKEKSQKLVEERMKKQEDFTPFEKYLEKRKEKKKEKRKQRELLKDENSKGLSDSEDLSDSDVDVAQKIKKTGKNRRKSSESTDEDEKQKKAELELLLMDKTEEQSKHHFNIKEIEKTASMTKSKRKRMLKKRPDKEEAKEDDFQVNVQDPRFNALFTSHHYNIDPADPHYKKTKGSEAIISAKLKKRAAEDVPEVKEQKRPKEEKKLSTELQALVKSVKNHTKNINRPIK
ncbi:ESF1 homolog [Prorops nasuta]|uniref:ESF1 homolog n=1 Tax=Prorops nasuta TaxID=863751 RepID=UPI0034CD206A